MPNYCIKAAFCLYVQYTGISAKDKSTSLALAFLSAIGLQRLSLQQQAYWKILLSC